MRTLFLQACVLHRSGHPGDVTNLPEADETAGLRAVLHTGRRLGLSDRLFHGDTLPGQVGVLLALLYIVLSY